LRVAEVTAKRLGEILRGAFAVLMDATEPVPAAEVITRTAERVPPTPFEQEGLPKHSNIRRFDNLVRFATLRPVKAEWLIKARDGWTLTEDGRAAYAAFPDPEALHAEASRLYQEWKEGQPQPEPEPEPEAAAFEFEAAEEGAWTAIREYLAKMPPYEFQNLVAALLKAMGYHVLWVAPPGPDRGIDMIAYTDPLGTRTPRIKVQVKRQPGTKTDAHALRAFIGTLGANDVGIYVSAGGFTSEAEREARSEQRQLTLIDLDRLVRLWMEFSDQLGDTDRQRLPLKPIYFLAPPE
jgi:restriction system protein